MTGCSRFAASCDGTTTSFLQPIVAFALLGLLLLVPKLAALAAAGAVAVVVGAVPTALILSATGEAAESRHAPPRSGSRSSSPGWWVSASRSPDVSARCHRGPVPYPEGMPSRPGSHELSTAAQQYLLALRVMTGTAEGGRVTAAQVARSLGVTTQAASEMFRRLLADGLVAHADGRDLHLTTAGRTAADAIFRRHALLEWLLTTVIGLGWAESDDEAMRLQGAISPRVEARLDEMLGHPETCPHGNPIDAETAKRRPAGTPLSKMSAGDRATIYRITEEAEEDAGLLSYLEARALMPGAHVTILARSESLDSLTLDGPRGRATLGLRPASLVRVLPGEADPGLFHKVPAAVAR